MLEAQNLLDGTIVACIKLLALICIQVLKSTAVRNYANGLAYKNPALATDDAMRIGRLHTFLPGQLNTQLEHMNSETGGV